MRLTRRSTLAALSVVLVSATAVAVPLVAEPETAAAATTVDWGDLSTEGTTLVGPSPTGVVLDLTFGMTIDDAALAAEAMAVNDPTNPRYGEESTVAEVGRRTVSDAAIHSVVSTLTAGGATNVRVHESRVVVTADLTVADANALFGVTWQRYSEDGIELDMPSSTPVLPAGLDGHVDDVYGALQVVRGAQAASLPVAPPSRIASGGSVPAAIDGGTPTRTGTPDAGACPEALAQGGLLPGQIADAYGLDALHAQGIDGSGVRLAVVDGSRYQHSDLAAYRACLAPGAPAIVDHVIGEPGIDLGTVEAALDLSVVSSMVPGLERLDEFMVGSDELVAGSFLEMVAAPFDSAATGGQDPDVVSLSYGMCESMYLDDPMAQPAYEMSERILATAAAARVSFFVSTGDSGSTACAHNEGSQTEVVAAYPATSAWVTAVGGTNLTLDADNEIVSSGAWNDLEFPAPCGGPGDGGTGGISQFTERPSWQHGLVPSAAGRAVPDVALFADSCPGWTIYSDISSVDPHYDGWVTVGGTSASAPLTASLAALVDQVNEERGQPSLGFANPLLYSLAATDAGAGGPFLDITLGTNAVFPGISSYPATAGYDFATGLGSVFADRLADALADPSTPTERAALRVGHLGGSTVELVADPHVHGGTVLGYAWDFDDDGVVDQVTSGPRVEHTYEATTAAYTASVTVRTSLARSGTFRAMFVLAARPVDGVGPAFTG